ncbi:phospholipase-like protein [Tanacetum coccineum]
MTKRVISTTGGRGSKVWPMDKYKAKNKASSSSVPSESSVVASAPFVDHLSFCNTLPMAFHVKVYDAKVSQRTKLYLLKIMGSKLALKPDRYKKFKSTIFGLWLDIRTQEHDNHLINYLLQHQIYVKDPSTDIPFIFDIGLHTLEFGRREFCLVIDFRFEDCSLDHLSGGQSGFRDRVFLEIARVKGIYLNKLLHNQTAFNNLLNDDDVRVCLLLALDFVFMGYELRHVIANESLNLVNDLSAWNKFPWGEHMWLEFHKRVYNNDYKYRKGHLKKLATLGPTYLLTYTLHGFVFAFKIWLLETFPNSKTWWNKQKNVIPMGVAWSDGTPFVKNDYDRLFHVRSRLSTLIPSADEMNKTWWRSSLEYFHNVSNAKVCREVHVRTDVQHYVDEGLSVAELVKKIADMQQDFQSHITSVEQYVKHHKTSSIGYDSPLNNVFSDTMEFDHDSFSSFTENPDNRAALMNKIMDMEVEFQRRITAIEQYLTIPTSSNVEKTSNVVEECIDVDLNSPVYANTIFDIVLIFIQALEEPHVAGKNFIDEEDQQFSSKNLEVPLEGEELFAVESLMKMIDFDIPKELPTQPMMTEATVQGCNNGETAQSMTTDSQSQDAIHNHSEILSVNNADFIQGTSIYGCYICGIIDRQKLIGQSMAYFFNTFMLGKKLSCCYANDVTNSVPWFAQSVKKVYFPINEEDVHWILAELHICSGVITFYDSLPSEEVNVPRQGNVYGDCRIWVMRNLYRLVNNLSFESTAEYGASTSIEYGVSNFLSNTAYSFKLINMAYPLPLDTAYRSSVIETEILCMTRSSINKLFTPYKEPEREFRSSRRHFKSLSLDELRSPDFNLLSDQEYSEEEKAEAMTETMEQYISKTRIDYGSGVARPKIDNKDQFELKGQFLKELRENTF